MPAPMDVAKLIRRDSGSYPEPESCLTCNELVPPMNPHIFVRDADDSIPDDQALIGSLHIECEETYLKEQGPTPERHPSSRFGCHLVSLYCRSSIRHSPRLGCNTTSRLASGNRH